MNDNIFIDHSRNGKCPPYNGLYDYGALLTVMYDTDLHLQNYRIQTIRKINKYSMTEFMLKLSFETWNYISDDNDVNTMFNSFLNTFLKILYLCSYKKSEKTKSNAWITPAEELPN